MKDEEIDRPQAMKIRQGIQDAMTYSLPDKNFSPKKIDVIEVDIELDNLGWDFHNFRILNLCDIHMGQWINPEYLDDLIDYVNTLNYDIVTLTGDYVSYVIDGYDEALKKSLGKLKSPGGKFGVLGNHDHWMGSDKIREIFDQCDIVDLSNDVRLLSRGDDKLNLAGVDSCTVCADNLDAVFVQRCFGLKSYDRLVQEHLGQNGAEDGSVSVGGNGFFHRLGNGAAERTAGAGELLVDLASDLRFH